MKAVIMAGAAALALFIPLTAEAQQQPVPSTFTVTINLSPTVRDHANKIRQQVKVIATYGGAPKPRYADQVAGDGDLELGYDEFAVPRSGTMLIFGRGLNRSNLHMVRGPVTVTLQIIVGAYAIYDTFSGPNKDSDNLLVCSGFGRVENKYVRARFADLAAAPKILNCAMPKGKFAIVPRG